jgi:hypothetical protein
MSNYLALATVTATLSHLLQVAAAQAVSGATVTTQRPETANNRPNPDPVVNLYLFQVVPNVAFRNTDLSTRRSNGALVKRPLAALDLHYLLTFYGADSDLEPQRMMGSAVSALHAKPVLTRADIERITSDASPQFVDYLETSDLAQQVESVKLSPLSLNLEELSKLWSVFFQTPYALSIGYQASVVLIESEVTPQTSLPVRAPLIYAQTFRQPVIETVRSQDGPTEPIVMGSTVLIQGRQLRGDATAVVISGTEIATTSVTNTEIVLTLNQPPAPADPLRAGVRGLQVVQSTLMGLPATAHRGVESNVAALVLHPSIIPPVTAANVTGNGAEPRSADLNLTVDPEVGPDQRVVLVLNQTGSDDPASYTFVLAPRDAASTTLTMPVTGVMAGTYLVRVMIDGAESPLTISANPLDPQYTGPTVTIP